MTYQYDTFTRALMAAKDTHDRGYTFLDSRLQPRKWSFAALVAEAARRAAYLLSRGLEPGDRVGVLLNDSQEFTLTFFACVWAGILPVPILPPSPLAKTASAHAATVRRILDVAEASAIVCEPQVLPGMRAIGGGRIRCALTVDEFRTAEDRLWIPAVPSVPSAPCFIQFTSGSTADPKGVVVTHSNAVANCHAMLVEGIAVKPYEDVGVSWLPLYHDMGLVGFVLAPLYVQTPVVFIPTMTFVRRPRVWMSTVSEFHGTITFAPNFGLALATRARSAGDVLDLRALRVVGCGGEPVNPETVREFQSAFEGFGLSPHAVLPCYGMAENTLAITFHTRQRMPRCVRIDRERYEAEAIAVECGEDVPGLELYSCGEPFREHAIDVVDSDGVSQPEGRVGEIVFRGPSASPGYFQNAEATARSTFSGWWRSGDLGFRLHGRLYISGRSKDLIILNGKNYYPQALEWEVEDVPGVRVGSVAAFSVLADGQEKLIIAAEIEATARDIGPSIAHRLREVAAVTVHEVVTLKRGQIPKTTSGKVQRQRTRELYLRGEFTCVQSDIVETPPDSAGLST